MNALEEGTEQRRTSQLHTIRLSDAGVSSSSRPRFGRTEPCSSPECCAPFRSWIKRRSTPCGNRGSRRRCAMSSGFGEHDGDDDLHVLVTPCSALGPPHSARGLCLAGRPYSGRRSKRPDGEGRVGRDLVIDRRKIGFTSACFRSKVCDSIQGRIDYSVPPERGRDTSIRSQKDAPASHRLTCRNADT